MACNPDPQSRLTFMAGPVSGTPACRAATRDRYMSRGSVLMTWPKTVVAMSPGAIPARAMAARAAVVARSMGVTGESDPPKVPMAVRAPDRMWMSVMGTSAVPEKDAMPCDFVQV